MLTNVPQNLEQQHILAACGTTPGRFLEIGAFNPEVFSNTRALFLQGWGGVMVEPSPVPFANLEAAYKGVGSVVLLNVAVVLEPVDSVRMWITDDAVSTTEQGNYDRWKNCAKFTGELEVPAVTLEQIYATHGDFDFVSVDTEGTSTDLAMRLLTLGKLPKCLCVEHDNREEEILSVAGPLGYRKLYASGENLVLGEMKRCVVNLATGYFLKGQARLKERVTDAAFLGLDNPAVIGAPSHAERPYAFKAFALKAAEKLGFTSLLWADSCIVPIQPLDRIWERTAKYGVWLSRNGYWNYEWTANSAYADLGITVEENKTIQHVVGGAFALDLEHPVGRAFLAEHFRLASTTQAFCGPWTGGIGVQHRHDQSVSSVLAHRLQIPLTDPPDYFAYKGGETDQTLLIADGSY